MNKKWKIIIIILIVLLVLGIGVGVYFAFFKNNQKSASSSSNSSTSSTNGETGGSGETKSNEFAIVTATEPSLVFAVENPNNENGKFKFIINLFGISNKQNSDKTIFTDYDLVSGELEASSANGAVQWSKDGKVFAYAYGDEGGMNEPAVPNSFNLIVVNSGISETAISGVEVSQVPKWRLLPDGKSIIYTKGDKAGESAIFSLNKYDLSSKKHTELVKDITSYGRSGGPIILAGDSSKIYIFARKQLYNYSNLFRYQYDFASQKGSEEIMLDNIDKSKAFMGSFSESDVVISPDGKQMAYRVKMTETRHGIAIYNFATKASKDLYSPDDKRSVNNIIWSPDSKMITFVTTFFGAGDGSGQLQGIYKVNVETSDSSAVVESTPGSSNVGFFLPLGWSPDGNKIAYTIERKLKLYDIVSKTSSEVGSFSSASDNLKAFSWVGF